MRILKVVQFQKPQDFNKILFLMQEKTQNREDFSDEIWLLEHHPVYTLGLAGEDKHIINKLPHPIVRCDRGGQVTFHGPGQIICYFMLDLKSAGIHIIDLINSIETIIINTLKDLGIDAKQDQDLGRGVFVNGKKIASIGIKVRKYMSYHGFALNYSVDLSAFSHINPCGHENLSMTNIVNYSKNFTRAEIHTKITTYCYEIFKFDSLVKVNEENRYGSNTR